MEFYCILFYNLIISINDIFSIINSEKDFSKEKFGNKKIGKVDGNFEFKNVHFAYEEGQEVLKGVNFKNHLLHFRV